MNELAQGFRAYVGCRMYTQLSRSKVPDEHRLAYRRCANATTAAFMNELCRSMGQADFYPFAPPHWAVTKLHFVHLLVRELNTENNPPFPALAGHG